MAKIVKMSIFIFTVLMIGMYGSIVGAVPAAGVMLEYSQPSGETFKAALYGDEKLNWVVSETGEVIVQDKDKYWKFAEKIKGKIQPSKYKYSKAGQKPLEVIKDKDIIIQIKKDPKIVNSSKSTTSSTETSLPESDSSNLVLSSTTGSSQKIIALLVEFSDVKMKYSEAQWSNQFFGTTGSTVNSYYREVSNGMFSFASVEETAGTVNDGIIKVTLNYKHPNTGGNIGSANQKIVTDALTAANPYINYAAYDTNGDGKISTTELHVVTIVAGYEAAYGGGVSPTVWAHRWATSVTLDGKYLSYYTQQGEVHYDHMATIGVLAHELGHDLGLPDLYDYDGSSLGVGIHSIMAGGSWASSGGYPGNSPTHFDAWSKAKLGFITPTVVSSGGGYTVKSFDTGQYNVLKVPTSNSNQYFLVENRQNAGFDKGLAKSVKSWGIAIWHIDESILNSNYWRPNDNEARKGVDLEEANEGSLGYSQLDKRYYSNYYHYYSSSNATAFNSTSIPNSNLYDGTKTNISITANVASSNSMTVNISLGGTEVPPVISNASVDVNPFAPTGSNTATISYTISKDAKVTVVIYDVNNSLVKTLESNVQKAKGDNSTTWDGKNASGNIVGDAVYSYKINAVDSTGLSAVPVTGNITIEKDKPAITNVTDSPDPYTAAGSMLSTINYTLSENANVNIKIYDSNNNLVKSLLDGQVTAGAKTITWNGKDDSAKPAQNGVYTYKINASDSFNNAADEVQGTITIDRGAPITLTLYGHKPDPVRLYSRITYGIDQIGYVRLNIYDSNNNLVRSLINNVKRNAGIYYTTWTGRNNSNAAVPSGVYIYTIEAEDLNGNISGPFSGTITVDRTGPEIIDLSVSENPFVPNGDNSASISYKLSEDGKVTVNIFSNNNVLLKTIINRVQQPIGNNLVAWNGKDKYNDFTADGIYTVKVSAYDILGNRSATKTQTISVDTTAPSIDDVSDGPDPFGVGAGQVNTIKYTVSENAHVTINIFDNRGNLIRNLFDGDVILGARQVTWDGKNDSGISVENGIYTYKINAIDPSGKVASEKTGTITTDNTPVVISNVSINPSKFTPSGAILYTISKDAKVIVKILDSANQLVKVIENDVQMTAGNHISTWDGKNSLGTDVSSGTYKFKITAVDAVGFNAVPAEGTIELVKPDKDAPKITNVSDGPDPMKLGSAGAVNTIKFTLSENATVTLKIFDSNNNLVKTLINSSMTAGENTVEWDGKNGSGALVSDGNYIYKINAADEAGNVGTEVVGTITTDKTPITITNVSINPSKFAISGSINYTLSEAAKVTIVIYDDKNNQINTIANAVSQSEGQQTSTWDGKDSNGFDVQSGNYTYIITAVDKVGFMTSVQGNITVDGPAPVISNLSSSPEPFIALGINSVTINYTISSNANVTLKVYDSTNKLVKTILNNNPAVRGQNIVYWNGKNDLGVLVSDGSYTYKINAVDILGKASNEAAGTITVDKTAPVINNVSVSPNPFGTGSIATISYNLSENAKVSVKILDGSNNVIKVLEDNLSRNSGSNSAKWDGKDSKGNFVTGYYIYTIAAVDSANFSTTVTGGITCIDGSKPTITDVTDSPDPFNLNGTNTVNISYTLSKNVKVTVKIFDSNNNLVKTVISNTQQIKGQNTVWWNGKNDSGVLVADGIYTYKINAVDDLGNYAEEAIGTFAAGTHLTISSNTVSSDPFLANGTSTVTISYTLSKKADITVKIYDSLDNVIKTVYSGSANSGNNSAQWDGKDGQGNIVQDDIYTYEIEAVDSISQKASVTGNFVVVGSSPEITNINDNPDPFKADGSLSSINYTLSKNSLVTVEIFDQNNKSVRMIVNGTAAVKGANTLYWDGKDSSNNTVSDGVYTYIITAVDPYSKESVQGTGTITVQKYPPAGTLKDVSLTPNPYAPNGGSNAVISYTLTGEAYITISIIDSNNSTVKTIQNSVLTDSGTHTASWDGKGADGKTVSDGIYTLKISAVNGIGVGSSVNSSFTVERLSPVISEVSDTPDPFKPNGVDLWSLKFNLSEDANVYLEFTLNNSVVWTARPVIFTKGSRTIELYGTNDSGQLLNDGVYTYKLWALDFMNKKSNEVTGTLTIDKTAPVITVDTSTKSFDTSITIPYNLSENAKVTITISNGSTAIRILEENVIKNSGDNTVTWDGKDSQGSTVDNGSYTYTITAADGVGLTSNASGTIIKDSGTPVISNVSDSNDPFTPSGSNYTTITFSISKNAYVGIKVYDSNGILIKTLLNDYPAVKGLNSADWDGKDDSNTIVSDGAYIYRINAVDTLGNSAVQVGGTVTVDKTAPVISNFKATPYPFAPNGSDKMTIGYNLSEAAVVTMEVIDDLNNVLVILENKTMKLLGDNTTLWDGYVNGAVLEDGIYRVKVTAADNTGNSTEYYDYVGIDRFTPQIVQVDDNPDPFNPTVIDFSTIHGEFSEWFATAKAALYDKNSSKVKEVDMEEIIEFWWGWSGTDSLGNKVNDGVYTYKVNGTDLFGKAAPEAFGTITVDSSVPEISGLSFTPELDNPRGTINYMLSISAKVSIAIYDDSNNLINQLELDVQRDSGSNSAYWDGTSKGTLVGYGIYTYKITAVGLNSANALPAVGVITFETIDPDYVDNTVDDNIGEDTQSDTNTTSNNTVSNELVISEVSDRPDVLLLGNGQTNTIKFKISKDALITINIYDSNKKIIKTLTNNNYHSGVNSVVWDGKNHSGSFVSAGAYTYEITGVDTQGNYAKPVSGTISIGFVNTSGQNNSNNDAATVVGNDGKAPLISNVSVNPRKFAPSGTINYTISEPSRVTLVIYNRMLVPVRTLESNVQKNAGNYSVAWDGKDSQGFEVDDVVYTYKITAVDKEGLLAEPATGIINVDAAPFTVTAISVSPTVYTPRGAAGGLNPATVTYTLPVNAKVSAVILSSDGKLVRKVITDVESKSGVNTITWHGTDYNNAMVTPGTYTCKITAVNGSGRQSNSSINIVVQ